VGGWEVGWLLQILAQLLQEKDHMYNATLCRARRVRSYSARVDDNFYKGPQTLPLGCY